MLSCNRFGAVAAALVVAGGVGLAVASPASAQWSPSQCIAVEHRVTKRASGSGAVLPGAVFSVSVPEAYRVVAGAQGDTAAFAWRAARAAAVPVMPAADAGLVSALRSAAAASGSAAASATAPSTGLAEALAAAVAAAEALVVVMRSGSPSAAVAAEAADLAADAARYGAAATAVRAAVASGGSLPDLSSVRSDPMSTTLVAWTASVMPADGSVAAADAATGAVRTVSVTTDAAGVAVVSVWPTVDGVGECTGATTWSETAAPAGYALAAPVTLSPPAALLDPAVSGTVGHVSGVIEDAPVTPSPSPSVSGPRIVIDAGV